MHVDRARFLLLTASIASAQCSPKPADSADAEVKPVTIEPSSDDPFVVERTSTAGDAEHSAVAAQCKALRPPPGPHCESFEDTVEDCQRYGEVLQPSAAEQASACLASKSGSRAICEWGVSGACFVAGASKLTASNDSAQPCRTLLRQCAQKSHSDLTYTACRAGYSAVRSEQRNMLITCITESCTLRNCYWSLEPH